MTRNIEDRLRDAFTAGAELVSPESLAPVASPAPVQRRRGLRGLPILAAAAVAVVLTAVVLVSNLIAVPAPVSNPAPPPADGNEALRRLAARVARLPDDHGVYWHRSLLNDTLIRVRAGGRTFNAKVSSKSELWLPRDPKDPVQTQNGEPILSPATPADERAWQAAGSPGKVERVCTSGTRAVDCVKLPMLARNRVCQYTRDVAPSRGPGADALGRYTTAEILALPADEKGLREWLRAEAAKEDEGRTRPPEEVVAGSRFLLSTPLRPAVRATVLRLLADLPTTGVRGMVEDPLSREGLAVDFDKGNRYFREFGEDDEVTEDHTTVLDPATGEILAQVTRAGEDTVGLPKGQVVDSQTWTPTTRWTDDRPERPRNCRRL
ncbi:CU044_5270 family protein [Nonomuraea sp. NPDC005692]|uniref:CU044_5270 family protein n=1 Tax=Nonomuraea sp. NPDC005692 TaxID=3157168 RepID=UPI0034045647